MDYFFPCSQRFNFQVKNLYTQHRAQCYIKLNDFENSINDCQKCLELNPLYIKAIYRLAVSYEASKEYAKANKELEKLLHYDKTNTDGVR